MPRKKGLDLPGERVVAGPAQVWKRLGAFLVDMLILDFTVLLPFQKVLGKLLPIENGFGRMYESLLANEGLAGRLITLSVAMSVFMVLYFAILETKIRTTPGKYLFKISVQGYDKELKFWQAVVRSLFLVPVFPFFLLWVLDPLFLIFSKSSQRLSEIFSKTRTVEMYRVN